MIKAIDTKILVKPIDEVGPVEKLGGLVMPVGMGDHMVAEVVSVGSAVTQDVSVGDKLYLYQGAGKELIHDGDKYRVITITDVLAAEVK